MPVIRIVRIILAIILVVTMLQACNTQGRIQKELDEQFLMSLSLNMSIDEIQDVALNIYGEKLVSKAIGLDSLLYYCYERRSCYPNNLPDQLNYIRRHKSETTTRLENIQDSDIRQYYISDPALAITRFGLGKIKRNIVVFYDDKSERIIGWISNGTDPIKLKN